MNPVVVPAVVPAEAGTQFLNNFLMNALDQKVHNLDPGFRRGDNNLDPGFLCCVIIHIDVIPECLSRGSSLCREHKAKMDSRLRGNDDSLAELSQSLFRRGDEPNL